MTSRSRRRAGAIVSTSVLVIALVFAVSQPALANDGIVFNPPTQSVQYGQNWEVSGTITPESSPDYAYGTLTVTTGTTTKNLGARLYNGTFGFSDGDFDPMFGVGTHSFSAVFSGGSATASSATPAVVTITPAPILATTTIVPDPSNSLNAIVTAQLSGEFIDQLPNCGCEGENGYLLPAGTWNLTITDSGGKTVFSKQLAQPSNGLPTFVNYWQNVPKGDTFSAQSTFTVSGAAASNFTFTSQKFSWTSSKPTSGGAVSPSNTPRPQTIKPAAFAPPTLVFYAALLVAVILVALDVALFLLRRKSRLVRQAGTTEASEVPAS